MRLAAFFLAITGLLSAPAMANEALATQSGCLGCHKADTKLVGPAFKDIAAKYKRDPTALKKLTARVKAGSKPGEPLKWGEVAMPPNAASEADIRAVIKWILTH